MSLNLENIKDTQLYASAVEAQVSDKTSESCYAKMVSSACSSEDVIYFKSKRNAGYYRL